MGNLAVYDLKTYLDNLAATNEIYTSLGASLAFGRNLFLFTEPPTATVCMTIIPYPGPPPEADKQRFESNVQIRLKTRSPRKTMETLQSVINLWHENATICASFCSGKIFAIQSNPMLIDITESGEYYVGVSNFRIKHIKPS